MEYERISIKTTPEGIEPLSGRLYNLGVTGLEIIDEEDFRDFLENNRAYWDYVDEELEEAMRGKCCVCAYISKTPEGAAQLEMIKSDLRVFAAIDTDHRFGSLEISFSSVREEDWANNWKKYFKPIYVGRRLLIKPEWESVENTDGLIVYETDPGMSFGSGQHETTRLCAEEIEKVIKQGDAVLDVGCGSGILSHVALLFGAKSAFALDIDPDAVRTAYKNAERNGISHDRFEAVAANILEDAPLREKLKAEKFDLVAANIVADVIVPLAAFVPDFMKDGATFIASGIIEFRLDDVKKAIEAAGLEIKNVRSENDWYCVVAKKR